MRNGISTIHRNSAFAFLATFTRLISNALMFVMVARAYGPEPFGTFALAHTYLTSFYLIADFGFEVFLASEVARNRARVLELVPKLFPLKILFSLLATILMCSLALVSNFSADVKMMMVVFSLSIIATACSGFFFAIFKGLEQFQHETFVSFFQNMLLLILLAVAALAHFPVLAVAWIFVGTRLLGFGVVLLRAKRIVNPMPMELDLGEWRALVATLMPYGIFLLCGTLYFQFDTIVLGYFADEKNIGIYQAVFKLIALCLISGDVLVQSMLPVLSRLHEENHLKWQRASRFLGKTLMLLGLVWSGVLFIYPTEILGLVYGNKQFALAKPVLEIFAFILLFRFASEVYALMLTTSRHQKSRTVIVFILAIISFLLSLAIIPYYGITGAALVSLATNTIGGVMYSYAAMRLTERGFRMIDRRFALAIAVCVFVAITVWLSDIQSFPLGGGALVLCMFTVFLLVGYSSEERRFAFSLRR